MKAITEAEGALQKAENELKLLLENNKIIKTDTERVTGGKKRVKQVITEESSRLIWQKIRDELSQPNFTQLFDSQVRTLSYDNLRLFVRYNRLPVDTKRKKDEIIKQIAQVLRAGAAIQGQRIGGNYRDSGQVEQINGE